MAFFCLFSFFFCLRNHLSPHSSFLARSILCLTSRWTHLFCSIPFSPYADTSTHCLWFCRRKTNWKLTHSHIIFSFLHLRFSVTTREKLFRSFPRSFFCCWFKKYTLSSDVVSLTNFNLLFVLLKWNFEHFYVTTLISCCKCKISL